MEKQTPIGLHLLAAGLLLGLLGDLLLRAVPWGLNLPVCTAAFVAAAGLLARRHYGTFAKPLYGPLLALLLFAALFVWRDAPALYLLNLLGMATCLGLAAWRAEWRTLAAARLSEYAFAAWHLVSNALLGAGRLVLQDVPWREVGRPGWSGHALAAGRGLVVALPLLLLFGGLFRSADEVFAGLIDATFDFSFEHFAEHLLLTGFFAWGTAGLLRALLVKTPGLWSPSVSLSFGRVEVTTILGPLNLLFLLFLVVQARYLFGGAALVALPNGLSYAEYARRGFFELVAVAALTLPLLLFLNWSVREEGLPVRRLFRALALGLVLQLFVVILSAGFRMALYQQAYGLTVPRLYATAFMLWLAGVFLWLIATVLRGRSERFASGAVAAGLVWILALNVLDPDALIARVNTARLEQGKPFDAAHAASALSADAVPELLRALPMLDPQDRREIAGRVAARWLPPPEDWRNWNWSRARAHRLARAHEPMLKAVPVPSPPPR